jgi:hypothetical protein
VPRGSLIERGLRRLARLLPRPFREEFGDAIDADLTARGRAGDRVGLLRRELPSLARAIVREHLDEVRQDVRNATRMMRRTPGFTTLALAMFALGTGVNIAMFCVIDAVMLRSPFAEPDRIVMVQALVNGRKTFGVPTDRFQELRAEHGPFQTTAEFTSGPHVLTGAGDPFSPGVECVSAAMFDVLGTKPYLGRVFGSFDDRPEAAPAAVVSFGLWRRLGGTPSVSDRP